VEFGQKHVLEHGIFCIEYVLVCLWQIHDECTGIIFQEFHVSNCSSWRHFPMSPVKEISNEWVMFIVSGHYAYFKKQ